MRRRFLPLVVGFLSLGLVAAVGCGRSHCRGKDPAQMDKRITSRLHGGLDDIKATVTDAQRSRISSSKIA